MNGSGVSNFNTNAVPFGVVAGGSGLNDLTNTAFYIDRGGSLGASAPVTASLQISRGGSINMEGHITASGNISSSGDIFVQNITAVGTVTAHEFHTQVVSSSIIFHSGSTKFGDTTDDTHHFTGSVDTLGNITVVSQVIVTGKHD